MFPDGSMIANIIGTPCASSKSFNIMRGDSMFKPDLQKVRTDVTGILLHKVVHFVG